MNEASLKTKWRKHAAKHGIWSKSMSPHQIPGCPDIVAVDTAASSVIRDISRARSHWIEAKVVNHGPWAFRVERDATAQQVLWIRTMGILGASSWWLLLSDSTWLLVPWHVNVVRRETFKSDARKFGAPPTALFEPETKRKACVDHAARRIAQMQLETATLFEPKGRR